MDIAKFLERTVKFLAKAIFVLIGVCVALQIVVCWISRIRLSTGESIELLLVIGAASMIAYCIRKRRSPSKDRNVPRHGAERTPLMPRGRSRA
jgi:hypothetical protein